MIKVQHFQRHYRMPEKFMFVYQCQDLDGLSIFHLDHIKKSKGGLYSHLMDTLTSKFPLSDCILFKFCSKF